MKPRIKPKKQLNAYEMWKLGLPFEHLMPGGALVNGARKRPQFDANGDLILPEKRKIISKLRKK